MTAKPRINNAGGIVTTAKKQNTKLPQLHHMQIIFKKDDKKKKKKVEIDFKDRNHFVTAFGGGKIVCVCTCGPAFKVSIDSCCVIEPWSFGGAALLRSGRSEDPFPKPNWKLCGVCGV